MPSKQSVAAVNRFGLGAKPGELEQAGDPRGWLTAQLTKSPVSSVFAELPDSLSILKDERAYKVGKRSKKKEKNSADGEPMQDASASQPKRKKKHMGSQMAEANADQVSNGAPSRKELKRANLADIAARYRYAATTDQPFVERLVRFWSNHFAVSVDKGAARLYAAPMEREAVRPHVLGKFSDLLVSIETHPAMLRYLDNAQSVGEDSMIVQRGAKRNPKNDKPKPVRGLNENLAREILELHTLGVNGGYGQADVTELARAITGWATPDRKGLADAQSAFLYRTEAHEPGTRRILNKSYAEGGRDQGEAILADLAVHPATAKHLSRKLAMHFVADVPPPALVDRMARAYLASGGELNAIYRAMINDDAAWSADAKKYKTPDDFIVSAMRASAVPLDKKPGDLVEMMDGLGQPIFMPRSPAGFPDTANDWAAGDALRKRFQVATTLGERVSGVPKPADLAYAVLGNTVGNDFIQTLSRAGSMEEGYTLLFASPAFQWRA